MNRPHCFILISLLIANLKEKKPDVNIEIKTIFIRINSKAPNKRPPVFGSSSMKNPKVVRERDSSVMIRKAFINFRLWFNNKTHA